MSTPAIGGLVAALPTPRDSTGAVSEADFGRLVAALDVRGVNGFFVAGGQGQGWMLTNAEIAGLVGVARSSVDSKAVLCGISSGSTGSSLELARAAVDAGATHVVATPPVITGTDDAAVGRYLMALADGCPAPLVLYNHPARVGRTIPVSLARDLAAHDNVVAIKDSSGSVLSLVAYLAFRSENFRVLVGHDSLILAGLVYGCDGAVASTANVIPGLLTGLERSVREGELDVARELQARVHRLRTFDEQAFVSVVQQGMGVLGIPCGLPPEPTPVLDADRLERLRSLLEEIGAERFDGEVAA